MRKGLLHADDRVQCSSLEPFPLVGQPVVCNLKGCTDVGSQVSFFHVIVEWLYLPTGWQGLSLR